MKYHRSISILFLMFSVGSWYLHGQCHGIQMIASSLRITAEPNPIAVKSGEAIPVNLTVTNITKVPVRFWRDNVSDPGGYTYKVSLVGSNNDPVEKTRRGKVLDGDVPDHDLLPRERTVRMVTSGACMTLKPNESIHESIDLSRLYLITASGDYRAAISIGGSERAVQAAKMSANAAGQSQQPDQSTILIAIKLGQK